MILYVSPEIYPASIIAHFRGTKSVTIEDEAFSGPEVIILPGVAIGRGAVVTAGSVVTRSVPPMTMVQGNPAQPIAKCGISLRRGIKIKEFSQKFKTDHKDRKFCIMRELVALIIIRQLIGTLEMRF